MKHLVEVLRPHTSASAQPPSQPAVNRSPPETAPAQPPGLASSSQKGPGKDTMAGPPTFLLSHPRPPSLAQDKGPTQLVGHLKHGPPVKT